jgi:maleate isomerase
MVDMIEYAPEGLIGVLTPQANTTAEPEFSILCPPGVGLITARLTSGKASMDDRLVDYVKSMETTLDRFANAPLGVVAFACTGAAYLVEPEEENVKLAQIEAQRGYQAITAANAVSDALTVLGATRIGIVSPYGDPLHDRALKYWEKRGLKIAKVHRITSDDSAFHPIYSQSAAVSKGGLEALDIDGLQAIAMLGTGLPTLPTLLRAADKSVPVISPNLCLMWRSLLSLRGELPTIENLMPWVTGRAWADRFKARVLSRKS